MCILFLDGPDILKILYLPIYKHGLEAFSLFEQLFYTLCLFQAVLISFIFNVYELLKILSFCHIVANSSPYHHLIDYFWTINEAKCFLKYVGQLYFFFTNFLFIYFSFLNQRLAFFTIDPKGKIVCCSRWLLAYPLNTPYQKFSFPLSVWFQKAAMVLQ